MNENEKVKRTVMLGMLAAIAYVVMVVGRIPIMPVAFLKYDPKDIILAVTGFIFGPLPALLVIVVVAFIEMITVSTTAFIGFVMNVLSSAAFACTASYVYKKQKTMQGAVIGLTGGCLLMTAVMLLWNYLISPLYMGVSRDVVVSMLIPTFLPFNLLKGFLNMAGVLIVYKPIVKALRKAQLIPASTSTENKKSNTIVVTLMALFVIATCVLIIMVLNGKI